MPKCGEIRKEKNRTFMWDCKHKEWIDVTITRKLKNLLEKSIPLR
jgi:hypothetical protein